MKKQMTVAPLLLSVAAIAHAQSSVTLYGIADAGIAYRSNERTGTTGNYTGHSNVALSSGNLSGSRWGLRGNEELGNAWSALFQLETASISRTARRARMAASSAAKRSSASRMRTMAR